MCRLSAKRSRDCVPCMRASRDLNAGAASTDVQCESRIGVPWGKENGSLFCSSFMCRVVHLSRGHRVSPLTVGRLCVLALYLCGTVGIMNVSFVFRSRGVCLLSRLDRSSSNHVIDLSCTVNDVCEYRQHRAIGSPSRRRPDSIDPINSST